MSSEATNGRSARIRNRRLRLPFIKWDRTASPIAVLAFLILITQVAVQVYRAWAYPRVEVVAPNRVNMNVIVSRLDFMGHSARQLAGGIALEADHGVLLRHLAGIDWIADAHRGDGKRFTELEHTSPQMLYSTHRELVLPSEAERYWKLEPRSEAANVVAFSASS